MKTVATLAAICVTIICACAFILSYTEEAVAASDYPSPTIGIKENSRTPEHDPVVINGEPIYTDVYISTSKSTDECKLEAVYVPFDTEAIKQGVLGDIRDYITGEEDGRIAKNCFDAVQSGELDLDTYSIIGNFHIFEDCPHDDLSYEGYGNWFHFSRENMTVNFKVSTNWAGHAIKIYIEHEHNYGEYEDCDKHFETGIGYIAADGSVVITELNKSKGYSYYTVVASDEPVETPNPNTSNKSPQTGVSLVGATLSMSGFAALATGAIAVCRTRKNKKN